MSNLQTLNISLTAATIQAAYFVVHGETLSTYTYVEAGNDIVKQLGAKDAKKLFEVANVVIKESNLRCTYAEMAPAIRARLPFSI